MTSKGILAAAAISVLCATAALAQTTTGATGPVTGTLADASAPPGHHGWRHFANMKDPEFVKKMCVERYARRAGHLAYLEAKLDLTAAQKPLWDKWAQATADGATTMRDACLAGVPAQGTEVSALAREDRWEKLLSTRLDALKAARPALEALYQSLTPEQRATFDHPVMAETGGWRGWRHQRHGWGAQQAPL